MQLARRFRLPAVLCAVAVLVCELVSRPFVEMGVCDEGAYILTAQKLALTGHVVYNGWVSAMLGWQLYLAAAFIKLFGFSFTTVRMSTLLVAMALAFVLQRTFVRAGISEHNATIGTLALVLSPLYLTLSVTFMTDISGLFAIVLCLYGCMRALQAATYRATIGWLCFAVVTNAICGTSRQIAWLGTLVMVPSTIWLLRAQRRILLVGSAITLAGELFILICMHWFQRQLYTIPAPLLPIGFPFAHTVSDLVHTFLEIPFLVIPIMALFLPAVRKSRPRVVVVVAAIFLTYTLLAIQRQRFHPGALLQPLIGADWVGLHGIYEGVNLTGGPPLFLHTGVQVLLTIVSLGGLLGLFASFTHPRILRTAPKAFPPMSWTRLGLLLGPFTIAYSLFLVPRATAAGIFDRYLLPLLVVALICLVRYYQEQIQPRLPLVGVVFTGIMAIYGIGVTHNTFALYRARVALAAELRASGIPDTSVDNGWEYNMAVELQHADHINDPGIVVPANAYVPTPPLPAGSCPMAFFDDTPHIRPIYGVSFDPNACYGPAPFAPVTYSRWLTSIPGTLYVVRYTASATS